MDLQLSNQLKADYKELFGLLVDKGYEMPKIPENLNYKRDSGETFALSYPIQGILKYHGMSDPLLRIAYFPSISFNNGCGLTISYLKFDHSLKTDSIILNGQKLINPDLDRFTNALNLIRTITNINTKALLVSRNLINPSQNKLMGKGLGTSASGSAAMGKAVVSIIYDNDPAYVENQRLVSIFSRFLSGSGSRSATGGFSLWLSHPEVNSNDCYAIRLDRKEHYNFIKNISLITIPIDSSLRTTAFHKIATRSIFFDSWLRERKKLILEFINALDEQNLEKIGKLAEYDTFCLQAISSTCLNGDYIIAWEPLTLKIMKLVKKLREKGKVAYFTIDSGPSIVILTYKEEEQTIVEELRTIVSHNNILTGNISGPVEIKKANSLTVDSLKQDINNLENII